MKYAYPTPQLRNFPMATKPGRPKKLVNGKRLNILMNEKSKAKATRMAFLRNISVGMLLEQLVMAELERELRRAAK